MQPDASTAPLAPTYRWRRRAVQKVRFTWLGMVFVLCMMAHRSLTQAFPAWPNSWKVMAFLPLVVLPMLLLTLWRLGLLPPERVLVAPDEAGDPRLARGDRLGGAS
ncbi:MAG: hypothetical protein VKP62_11455 [Candidatus Sericytochromatia bacterium]|nr:hypothetical protein [Candidatus Sericytochromatia bacterium]